MLVVSDHHVEDRHPFAMQAIRATLKALPAAISRWANGWIAGSRRMAAKGAMRRPRRTAARPPTMVRRPRVKAEQETDNDTQAGEPEFVMS